VRCDANQDVTRTAASNKATTTTERRAPHAVVLAVSTRGRWIRGRDPGLQRHGSSRSSRPADTQLTTHGTPRVTHTLTDRSSRSRRTTV